MDTSHRKIFYAISQSSHLCPPTLYHPSGTHLDPSGPPPSPKTARNAPKNDTFSLVAIISESLVWARPIVKSRMQSLCHVNPSHLGQPTLYHPSGTQGDPLPAPKRPETRPKTTRFPLSLS